MFRFSIRELLLITLVVGMGTAWAMDHRALVTVREDAESLARFGDPHRGACGNVAGFWLTTARKYWELAADTPDPIILPEDEAKLGLNTETP